MTNHRKETPEGDKEANSIARLVVEDPSAPLLIRARACMVLGCSDEDDFLEWAKEGVRTAGLISEVVGDRAGEIEKRVIESCKTVLRQAEEEQEQNEQEQAEKDKEEKAKAEGTAPKLKKKTRRVHSGDTAEDVV